MNLSTRLITLLFLLATAFGLNAQKASFEDVLSVELKNMGPILEDNQVRGYYMFYKVDKVDRKSNGYMLRILDENLKDVTKKKFIKPKHTILTEAVYNNNAFLFSFLDSKKKSLQLVTYDKAMKRLGARNYELDKWGMAQYQSQMDAQGKGKEASSNQMIFPMGDHGFVRYNMQKNKKAGYQIEYLPNDLKRTNGWKKSSPKDAKTMILAGYGDASDKYLASVITTKPKLLSNKDLKFHIQLLELETQKVLFEKELKSGRYIYSFMNAFINKDQKSVMVFGEYFDADADILKDRSKGLCTVEYNLDGEIIKKEHHSWTGKIRKMIGSDAKGRVEDGGFVAFHRIERSADGHYYAIGEMYKKAVSGLGIASQVLTRGSGAASMKMVVLDMIIFDFNPDLSLNNVEVFEKSKSDVGLPRGMGHQPPTLLSYVIRAYGGFDYAFTQMNEDQSSFFTTYASTEKEKGKKRKSYFGIISHTDGDEDYVLDKIDLTTDASNIRVYPAKPGYVLLTEYYKKKKKLETRLEKINY